MCAVPGFAASGPMPYPYRGSQGASDYYGHSGELPKRSRDELGGLKDWAISCLKSETGSQEGERRKRTTLSELRVIELSPDRPLLDSVELRCMKYRDLTVRVCNDMCDGTYNVTTRSPDRSRIWWGTCVVGHDRIVMISRKGDLAAIRSAHNV